MEVTRLTSGQNHMSNESRHNQESKFSNKHLATRRIKWPNKTVKILVYCSAILFAMADLKQVALSATLKYETGNIGEVLGNVERGGETNEAQQSRQHQVDWQLERALEQMLERGQLQASQQQQQQHRHQQATNQAVASLESQLIAPNSNLIQRPVLFETIPRPITRSMPQFASSARILPFLDAHSAERRNLPSLQTIQGNALDSAINRLNAIESLSSLLQDDNLSRLGRAYKPKTMSTARGFGKRSFWPATIN